MSESIYNEADLFRSETSIHGRAAMLAILMGGKFDVRKRPNMPIDMYAHFGASDGRLYGHMFRPNAPFSKGVIPGVFKCGDASSTFSDKINLILNGSMSTREVVETCFEENSIKYGGMDVSKFIEDRGQDILEMTGSLEEAAKILKDNDVCNFSPEMMLNLTNLVKEVFGKKKQITSGQQATKIQA